ncbi:NAD(P)H-binding protein [Afifella sp. YEN Y35]|uniref:NAD(P)H-binding protein n=1 Tax=Afifella sp. YEN Y35 TaxID=3388337 RepID=UPI0039DFFF94
MTDPQNASDLKPKRILVLGATGTIGRATVKALIARGHEVVCFVRPKAGVGGALTPEGTAKLLEGAKLRFGEVTDPASFRRDGFSGEPFDVLVSCLASRTGGEKDAWAIDYQAHSDALAAAREAGVSQMVLLSAICVQKPLLAFQQAKLAFEKELIASGLTYSIVRPTAFFKSLAGQIDRLRAGKPYLLFGDGRLTACKPISDDDLGRYLAECVDDDNRHDKILPIGGPGDAVTPIEQGERLFQLLGKEPKFKHVPVALMDAIIAGLSGLGRFSPKLRAKAELARIGRYYATESMLLLNPETGRYDAAATPSYGTETLFDFYARLVTGEARVERGDHAVF